MKFLVRMDVHPPQHMGATEFEELKKEEKEYSQQLQHEGSWPHIWRVVGEYSNYSIFEAHDNDHLHGMLQRLPLFPHMTISVTPLATHPSDVHAPPA